MARHWLRQPAAAAMAYMLSVFAQSVFVAQSSAWAFDITTHHYDTMRTGWNSAETILTPGKVASSSFGLIATVTVDEQVDAQPLVMLNQAISGKGTHNVVYVATENNTVYAIDADSGEILLSRHLAKPAPYSTTGYCFFNSDVIGIGATPVIDPSTGILYLIADTLERNTPAFQLYALKLSDLADAVSPVKVEASHKLSSGQTYKFNPSISRSRSALLLVGGNVYAGFGSYCDNNGEFRGWVLGWAANTLKPLSNDWLTDDEATSPNDFFLSAIWMSGSGIASDGSSLYFVTGNSDPSGTTWNNPQNLTESVVKLSTNLATLQSFFTPDNYPSLDQGDTDFGSGGIMLLPTQSGSIPSLATALGKDGNLYLLNRASLGGYHTNENAVVGVYYGGGCWCAESYFTGQDGINRVVSTGGNQLQTWQVHTSPSVRLVADSWSQNIESGQDPGVFTTVSSNGKKNGIIWAIARPDGSNNDAVYLDAFNADNGHPLVTNMIAGYWPFTSANANLVPVVTNGKVYVGSYKQLAIFGLKTASANATIEPVAPPPPDLPPGLHRLSGTVQSVSGQKIVLTTHSGTPVTIDATDALRSAHIPVVGDKLTVVGQYRAEGTLFAQAISRAKRNPVLWPPDR